MKNALGGLKLFLMPHSTFIIHIDELWATHLYKEISAVLPLHGGQHWCCVLSGQAEPRGVVGSALNLCPKEHDVKEQREKQSH